VDLQIDFEIIDSLRTYNANIKLRKEAMNIIVKTLSYNEISELKNAFYVMDQDKTGYISAEELRKTLVSTGFDVA